MIEAPPLRRFRWELAQRLPTDVLRARADRDPLLVQLLHNRGIEGDAEAAQFLSDKGQPLHDPMLLDGMAVAVDRICGAISHGERIAVYGDYDADGITATALMTEALRSAGAVVEPYIPLRSDGYGLRSDALSELAVAGAGLVVTVDCGVGSGPEIAEAKAAGLDIIVTDHHAVTGPIPSAAVAVVNPRRPDSGYPDERLAGVGVAYKLAVALLSTMAPADADRFAENALDLVTIGTIADVVPLLGENRSLVKRGLTALSGTSRPGLRALFATSGTRPETLSERDVSHRLAPRINATGRLTEAKISLQLIMDDGAQSEGLARRLEESNAERQRLTEESVVRARGIVASLPARAFVAIRDEACLPGVAGLVAARLTEELARPVAVVVPLGGVMRGSVRSCTDLDVAGALAECSDILLSHGGHARAGGFSVTPEHFDELLERLSQLAVESEAESGTGRRLRIDAELALRNVHMRNYEVTRQLAPFGHSNHEPVFLTRNLKVTRKRVVGRPDASHLRLTLEDSTRQSIGAIAFRRGVDAERVPELVDVVYQLARDDFDGRTRIEARIIDLQPAR